MSTPMDLIMALTFALARSTTRYSMSPVSTETTMTMIPTTSDQKGPP